MEPMEVDVSSLEELETVIRYNLPPATRVSVVNVGAGSLFEAAMIYRRLQGRVASSRGFWRVNPGMMESLHRASEHYEGLDLLEIFLDLVDLDLKDGISMKEVRFKGVRETANDVVTTAPPSLCLAVLEDVTIEAQQIARVSRALGFGGVDLDLPMLTEDDLAWLAADGLGIGDGEETVAVEIGDGEGEVAIELGDGDGESKVAVELGDGDGNGKGEELGVEEDALGIAALNLQDGRGDRNEEALLPLEDGDGEGKDAVEHGKGEGLVLEDPMCDLGIGGCGDLGEEALLLLGEGSWVVRKAELVQAVLREKISKLKRAINISKRAPYLSV